MMQKHTHNTDRQAEDPVTALLAQGRTRERRQPPEPSLAWRRQVMRSVRQAARPRAAAGADLPRQAWRFGLTALAASLVLFAYILGTGGLRDWDLQQAAIATATNYLEQGSSQ